MGSKTLCSGETCIDKNSFHSNKSLISIKRVEINKIVLFDKTSYGNKGSFKRYIGYKHKDGTFSPLNVERSTFVSVTSFYLLISLSSILLFDL